VAGEGALTQLGQLVVLLNNIVDRSAAIATIWVKFLHFVCMQACVCCLLAAWGGV
jgi:hypothetical protein